MSANVPNVNMSGVANLASALQTSITDLSTARDEVASSKANAEYQTELIKLKKEYQETVTLDNAEAQSAAFNDRANNLMGETIQKYGISYKKQGELSARMQEQYHPANMAFSLQVTDGVRTTALKMHEFESDNQMGQLFTAAT